MVLGPLLNMGRDPSGVLTTLRDQLHLLRGQCTGTAWWGAPTEMYWTGYPSPGARRPEKPRMPVLASFHICLSKIFLQISAFSVGVTLWAPGSVYERSQ